MDWATNLQVFTPVSIALMFTYLVILGFLAFWAWSNRDAIKGWFLARVAESNSQDAIGTAINTSVLCLVGAAPISSLASLWAGCLCLFLKPEPKPANPPPAGPSA